ncbi:hypothetical protein ACQ4PT_048745 [Festuca glaucescens]
MPPTTAESEAAAHLSPPPAVVPGGGNEACEAVFDDSSSGTESDSRGVKRPRRRRGVSWEEKRARVLAAVPPGFLEPLPPRRSVTKQFWKAGYYDGKGQLLWSDHAQHSDMATRTLLNPKIESKHRAALLEANLKSLEPLQTRTPRANWLIHPEWVDRLKWAGLLPFARLVEATRAQLVEADGHPEGVMEGVNSTRLNFDGALITCLVDRWRPETHTFHFRWGEMAPTLQDVSFLLGLPLAGEPIGPLEAPADWQHTMDARFHGLRDNVGPMTFEKHGPRQAWLHEFQIQKFGYPATQMPRMQITRSLEVFIIWLLGKTMFTENHGNTINARYIPIAQEIADATSAGDITPRSWGSAVLAATYRGMCNGCELSASGSGILGCPLLLQLWSWERFPIGRPDISGQHPYTLNDFDADRIDMPTIGTLWTSRRRRFGHGQIRNCYPAFTEQFDMLLEGQVIWEPYHMDIIETKYPGGISSLCTRDSAYWMTKSKIIFDISVEEMSQQRVMRQFGRLQLVEPPLADVPLPAHIHMLSRKGSNKSAATWLQRLHPYVTDWETATTRRWATDQPFDLPLFYAYLQRYMSATRLRLSQASDPVEMPAPTQWDTYPCHSTAGSRHHAAELTAALQDEVAQYICSLSSGPPLGREQYLSFARRLEEKLRRIYAAITSTCSSDIVQYRAGQRPPRPSMHVQQLRPHVPHVPLPDYARRQELRPRLTPQPSPRPPLPDQAGGSTWQQQPSFDYWQA